MTCQLDHEREVLMMMDDSSDTMADVITIVNVSLHAQKQTLEAGGKELFQMVIVEGVAALEAAEDTMIAEAATMTVAVVTTTEVEDTTIEEEGTMTEVEDTMTVEADKTTEEEVTTIEEEDTMTEVEATTTEVEVTMTEEVEEETGVAEVVETIVGLVEVEIPRPLVQGEKGLN